MLAIVYGSKLSGCSTCTCVCCTAVSATSVTAFRVSIRCVQGYGKQSFGGKKSFFNSAFLQVQIVYCLVKQEQLLSFSFSYHFLNRIALRGREDSSGMGTLGNSDGALRVQL